MQSEAKSPSDGSVNESRDGVSSGSKPRRRLLFWVGAALVGAALLTLVIFVLFLCIFEDDVRTTRPSAIFEYARTAVTLAGILGAAVLAAIAIRRQYSTEDAHDLERERAELERRRAELERDRADRDVMLGLRDRYTTAANQLGSTSPAIRLAGVYAMAALANDWTERDEHGEVQSCINVLCAIMRTPLHTPDAREATPSERASDLEVRQTIVRVIREHLQPDAERHWRGKHFDFTGAVFDGIYDLSEAEFSGGTVLFDHATFSDGVVNFHRAEFSGGRVSFYDASFSGGGITFNTATFSGGRVSFDAAKFGDSYVDFTTAQFRGGYVGFVETQFHDGIVDFRYATFSGSTVDFRYATFSGSTVDFYDAPFTDGDVSFAGATFSGAGLNFAGATFSGTTLDFTRATFTGGDVNSTGATSPGGEVDFAQATFSGGDVNFTGATFAGGYVRFPAAVLAGGTVAGPWGTTLPELWPREATAAE